MPLIEINLLQQQQRRALRVTQANTVVAIVVGLIVGLQLLVAVFLYASAAIRSGEKDKVIADREEIKGQIKQLDEQQNSAYPQMTLSQQAKAYQSQLEAVRVLVDNHKYFTLYLSEIALNTPSQVVFNSFNTDAQNRLLVTGIADAYGDVSKLADTMGRLSFAKSATIQDAKLDPNKVGQGKAVAFTMVIQLKSAAELKKLPAPSKPSPGPSPSASPAASASPTPGGNS